MCGIFGVIGEVNASERVFLGLHNLQHRGQESAGIISLDTTTNRFHQKKGMGIVNGIFTTKDFSENLQGNISIGHVRYSTSGDSHISNAQPIVDNGIAIAHNGEIANQHSLRQILESKHVSFQTNSDTELFLQLMNLFSGTIEERIAQAVRVTKPSYSFIIVAQGKMIGVRDVHGIRPLEIGKTEQGYVLSSETVGFSIMGATPLREVRPGEIVIFDLGDISLGKEFRSIHVSQGEQELRCIFEQIYFSRPDSLFDSNVSVGQVRREFGKRLYQENPINADLVIEVPDSSYDAARGVSEESGLPYDKGFFRSHYIGRSFIEPTQALRDASVLKKQNVNQQIVNDKKIILVDDSIIRGTNMKVLVRLLKEKGGAKEVHVMISSPPYMNSCYLGIDTHDESQLIARHRSVDEIREYIGADSLTFLTKEGMLSNKYLQEKKFCTYCFDGIVQIHKS